MATNDVRWGKIGVDLVATIYIYTVYSIYISYISIRSRRNKNQPRASKAINGGNPCTAKVQSPLGTLTFGE